MAPYGPKNESMFCCKYLLVLYRYYTWIYDTNIHANLSWVSGSQIRDWIRKKIDESQQMVCPKKDVLFLPYQNKTSFLVQTIWNFVGPVVKNLKSIDSLKHKLLKKYFQSIIC